MGGDENALRAALSASASGIVFTAFDTPGFLGKPDKELYLRWVGLGSLFHISRFTAQHLENLDIMMRIP